MQIIENVYRVPEVTCNTYMIVEPDGLTIIDAGLPGSTSKTLAFISSLGKTPRDLKRILITHSDWDHIGSLRPLKQATGARTYASQLEADAMAQGRPSRPTKMPSSAPLLRRLMRFFFRPPHFRVDEILEDGQVLPVLGGLQVLATPGHSPGHISLFAASKGILFCGDSMVTEGEKILGSRPIYTWDADIAQASVGKQAALGARILCSGHGPVIMDAAGKFPL
ncbi:MAG TPA: MBL fold metallo-hydrolase [Anaerolineales bacterium]|nr:MBL fold metallo-hydrolase [Anaerolineales bacterium]